MARAPEVAHALFVSDQDPAVRAACARGLAPRARAGAAPNPYTDSLQAGAASGRAHLLDALGAPRTAPDALVERALAAARALREPPATAPRGRGPHSPSPSARTWGRSRPGGRPLQEVRAALLAARSDPAQVERVVELAAATGDLATLERVASLVGARASSASPAVPGGPTPPAPPWPAARGCGP